METEEVEDQDELIRDKLSERALDLYDVFGREWLTESIIAARRQGEERYAAAIKSGEEQVSGSLSQEVKKGVIWFNSLDEVREHVTLDEDLRHDLIDKVYDTETGDVIIRLPDT